MDTEINGRVLTPDEVMEWGDIIRYGDGWEMEIIGWAGEPVTYLAAVFLPGYTVYRPEPVPVQSALL